MANSTLLTVWDWTFSHPFHTLLVTLTVAASFWVLPFVQNQSAWTVPGPWLAKFSNLWLMLTAKEGNRSLRVHELHKKYGKFVRLAPNHISIADPDALAPVYGHSTGTIKSEFYDAFAAPGFPRGLFNTRDRSEHTRKRKIVSHTFAPKSITAFEPFVRKEVQLFLDRWDELCKEAQSEARDGPRGLKGYAWLDVLTWTNYWAFDTIGDLAFGRPFGMLESGMDRVPIVYEDPRTGTKRTEYGSAIQIINERGEVSATMGVSPPWSRKWLLKLPWFERRMRSVRALTGIALARVNDRLQNGSDRDDLLAKLQSGTDEQGVRMAKAELTAEALTQLIAGSDTTSNSSCAVLYHLTAHPQALEKLQAELDEALKDSEDVPTHDEVRELPYLRAVINESLRYHATSGIGLPRLIPEPGTHVLGRFFPAGSVLSVPTYTMHRSEEWWGKDAEQYRPERWLEADAETLKRFEKASNVFSTGPRACVGRNVAEQELLVFIAAVVRRYDMELKYPDRELPTAEGFLRKPTTLEAGIRRRRQ
ncbi:hypothetical protein OC846_002367 [Tilletia horrida]|uniref:Benzoate 4-monooxygenase n=1 Tax=Tilletia horrida TaxID=155126 RepID=A0AAN6GQZ0_9BASI|nr:hypothetical protein OC846_002367 [Tilletia horrida]KAK0567799.1 hypothetical protein OC861_002542 [Tilletia horrida]